MAHIVTVFCALQLLLLTYLLAYFSFVVHYYYYFIFNFAFTLLTNFHCVCVCVCVCLHIFNLVCVLLFHMGRVA